MSVFQIGYECHATLCGHISRSVRLSVSNSISIAFVRINEVEVILCH
jgi:hypothetical protein